LLAVCCLLLTADCWLLTAYCLLLIGERKNALINFVLELWIYQVIWKIPEELRAE